MPPSAARVAELFGQPVPTLALTSVQVEWRSWHLGAPDSDKPVPAVTDVNSYVESRVQPQINAYYRARAAQLQKRLRLSRGAEYALAMLAAGLGAAAVTTGAVGLAGWVAATAR